jgi:hypothetical protein
MSQPTAQEVVRNYWEYAICNFVWDTVKPMYFIMTSGRPQAKCIGSASTEQQAWSNAAAKLIQDGKENNS